MSIIRQDVTTKEWVILAPGRGHRPHEVRPSHTPRPLAAWEAACPFCPGNEPQTPPEVFRIPAPGGSGWTVRVVPNKFGALSDEDAPQRRNEGPLFREMTGVGHHEVIIETPLHNRPLPLMTDAEVAQVLSAYQARYLALRDDPRSHLHHALQKSR